MRTTIELPESVYRRGQEVARARGVSVEVLIAHALEMEFRDEPRAGGAMERVEFPLIHSKHPGTLDLTSFDFDDLFS